jgi:hypothetical protein
VARRLEEDLVVVQQGRDPDELLDEVRQRAGEEQPAKRLEAPEGPVELRGTTTRPSGDRSTRSGPCSGDNSASARRSAMAAIPSTAAGAKTSSTTTQPLVE